MTEPHFLDDPAPVSTLGSREHTDTWTGNVEIAESGWSSDEISPETKRRFLMLRLTPSEIRDIRAILTLNVRSIFRNSRFIGLSFRVPHRGKAARRHAKRQRLFGRQVTKHAKEITQMLKLPAACTREDYRRKCRRRVARG